MENLIEQFQESTKLNIEKTILDTTNSINNTLTTSINNIKKNLIQNIETDIKNNIISNITNDNLYETNYGKMTNDEINNFCEEVEKNTDFYCGHIGFNIGFKTFLRNVKNKLYEYILNFDLDLDKNEYIIKLHQNLNVKFIGSSSNLSFSVLNIGICFINIITNLGNLYTAIIKGRYRNSQGKIEERSINPAQSYGSCPNYIGNDCIIVNSDDNKIITNIILNKIIIDIIKSNPSQILNCVMSTQGNEGPNGNILNIFKTDLFDFYKKISDIVKIYWATNGYGNYSIKFENEYNKLNQYHKDLIIAKKELSSKNNKIKALEDENKWLKSELNKVKEISSCISTLKNLCSD